MNNNRYVVWPVIIPKLLCAIILICSTCSAPDLTQDTIPLITKDTSQKRERENKLFVFVGEKISVHELPTTERSFDFRFKAKYKVLQRVYGTYPDDIVEFVAYDHYGVPAFSKFKHVLLFVSAKAGKLYHVKYQYDPVFRTKNGQWAGPYSSDYSHPHNHNTTIKPVIIDFDEEVSFPLTFTDTEGRKLSLSYPEPYYKTVDNKAIAVYGNYVTELFLLKKNGVLTARGFFGDVNATR